MIPINVRFDAYLDRRRHQSQESELYRGFGLRPIENGVAVYDSSASGARRKVLPTMRAARRYVRKIRRLGGRP